MSALPANLGQEDSLDPERILRVLPDRERETMARICEDPYDRLFSLAVRDEDPRSEWPNWVTPDSSSSRSMSLRDWSAYTT